MNQGSDSSILESLARDTHAPMDIVVALFERERLALAQHATVTNFITLLAARRVRNQLMHSESQH
jgi:Protein of unknown function (DUF3562)